MAAAEAERFEGRDRKQRGSGGKGLTGVCECVWRDLGPVADQVGIRPRGGVVGHWALKSPP